MSIPSPQELLERYDAYSPELLAGALGFRVTRLAASPVTPGVTVLSEYRPPHGILIYQAAMREVAERRDEPPGQFEQRLIAHELYHGLAEEAQLSAWRVRETAADLWADELMALLTLGDNV